MSGKVLASVSRTLTVVEDGSTVSAVLLSDKGSLTQAYTGAYDAPSSVYPDWAPTGTGTGNDQQPTVSFKLVSSSIETGVLYAKRMWWYLNEEEIEFDAATKLSKAGTGSSLGAFDGCFERIDADVSSGRLPGIKIVDNLVSAASGMDLILTGRGALEQTAAKAEFQAETRIQINSVTASDYSIVLYPVSGEMSITEHGGSVTLGVRAAQGTTPLEVQDMAESAPTLPGTTLQRPVWWVVQYMILESGVWTPVASSNGQLEVSEEMVQTELAVKAILIERTKQKAPTGGGGGSAFTETHRAQAMSTVYDDTDPLMILLTTDPEDGKFRRGVDEISLYPILTTRSFYSDGVGVPGVTTSPAGVPACNFYLQVFDQYGTSITEYTQMGTIAPPGGGTPVTGIKVQRPPVAQIETRVDAVTV